MKITKYIMGLFWALFSFACTAPNPHVNNCDLELSSPYTSIVARAGETEASCWMLDLRDAVEDGNFAAQIDQPTDSGMPKALAVEVPHAVNHVAVQLASGLYSDGQSVCKTLVGIARWDDQPPVWKVTLNLQCNEDQNPLNGLLILGTFAGIFPGDGD